MANVRDVYFCDKDQKFARYKRLPVIDIGGIKVRFLGVNEENRGVHFPKSPVGCPGQLLFLATDVVAASSIQRKNHIRVHARFSKLGLASKVRLVGFKIRHINSSTPIWFYSIKGLFRVAFELSSDIFQRDCLTLLQSEWLRRFNDEPLELESHVRYNLRLKMDHIFKKSEINLYIKQDVDEDNESDISDTTDTPDTVQPTTSKTSDTHVKVPITNMSDSPEIISDGTIVEMEEQQLDREMFLKKIGDFLDCMMTKANSHTQILVSQVEITCKYLQSITADNQDMLHDSDIAVFDMMNEYLTLVSDKDSCDYVTDHFGLTREKFTMMYVISDWLGQEFHNLQAEIAQKVLNFQKENIHNVYNLPPPEETIDTLYPLCMKKMIINWLGEQMMYPTQQSGNETPSVASDHDYCPDMKRLKLEKNKYSLAHLVLEFLTNLPISSITHAVHANFRAVKKVTE